MKRHWFVRDFMAGDRCGGPHGKIIYQTRDAARADLQGFRAAHGGHGSVKRCSWGDHYHLTKAIKGRGRKGRRSKK